MKRGIAEFTGGTCKCGAVYALDRSGHNLGEAFFEALTFLCNGDPEKAISLNPEDYEIVDFSYDLYSNTINNRIRGRKLAKLLFLKIKDC